MTTLSASLRLRPTRIGFLVDPTNTDSLRRVFQVCTCLWGGIYNPIIPVCSTMPDCWREHPFPDPSPAALAEGYINFFEPDGFIETQEGLADRIGLPRGELAFNQPRVVPLDAFFQAREHGERGVPLGTESFHIYKNLYEREFKFVPRDEHRVAIIEAEPAIAPFIEASFGGFPTTGPLAVLSRAYVDAFSPILLKANAENWVKVIKEGFRLPLYFTREGLKRDPEGWSQPTLFVVDPESTYDLIDLWNIRQFHSQVLVINFRWFLEIKDFIVEFVKANYRPLPGNSHGVMIHPTIQFGRSISKDLAEAAAKDAGLAELSGIRWLVGSYDSIWETDRDDHVSRPQRARISAASTELELAVSADGPDLNCRFVSLSPEFAPSFGGGPARWVNVLNLRGYGDGTAGTLALTLPSSFTDEQAHRLRLGEPTIVSREGFVLPQKFKEHREYFRLMTGKEAVIDWMGRHGVIAEASDAGRIADQVLMSLEGFLRAGLIADRDTIRLLDEMSKSVRKYRDGTLEEFADRSVEVKRWKDLVERRANTHRGHRVTLDDFIRANVFRLGLVLECAHCTKKNWFGIENLREQLTCERCLKSYTFPQGSLNFDRTPWQYRVVGPYSIPNYAEGAYSTVLALRVFAKGLGSLLDTNLTYSTGLKFKMVDANPFEIDFTFWYQRHEMFDLTEEPVLVFGEAKSFAVEAFKQDDFARMWKLAKNFPGAFLVFATLKDELNEVEKGEIGRLATWGRERLPDHRPRAPVIVLTGVELFSDWYIEQSWKDLGGLRAKFVDPGYVRLDNLWTLAELTQQIYLGLPSPHAHFQAPAKAC